jgi:hypothetical protein
MHGMIPMIFIIDATQTTFRRSFGDGESHPLTVGIASAHFYGGSHRTTRPTLERTWITASTTTATAIVIIIDAVTFIVHTHTTSSTLLKSHALFVGFAPTNVTK